MKMPTEQEILSAYEMGQQARESQNPEPICPFVPGTSEYTLFAEGFCEKGFTYE